ncbi:hypothetical protein ColLi_13419 [Colletotrichum liriopes]|uniref:Uncharacterized protein n=1 Tax=Colletotrichum liriopes TaxID=708192 RepID=A0AA37M0J6_9PEZI|nr:hypothetical protein ColLi_13419 [Colletotrichum liriopes]
MNSLVAKVARAADGDGGGDDAAPRRSKGKHKMISRADSDMAIISKSWEVRRPDLATHLPGLLRAREMTQIKTRWPIWSSCALVHSGVPGEGRQKIIDWFREFNEALAGGSGEYERHTKVFIITYAVSGTGLNELKVGNYCIHFGVRKNVNEEKQATARIDRQGQSLTSFVYTIYIRWPSPSIA